MFIRAHTGESGDRGIIRYYLCFFYIHIFFIFIIYIIRSPPGETGVLLVIFIRDYLYLFILFVIVHLSPPRRVGGRDRSAGALHPRWQPLPLCGDAQTSGG